MLPDLSAIVTRAVALRHDLHRHPELMHAEHRTAGVVRGELDRLGIPWRACANTGTLGFLAADKPGRRIAFRADLDALPLAELTGLPYQSTVPGKMHACGHDGHTASLLAAAAWLKCHEARLPQPVVLVFQPAEEGGHGAAAMGADGALDAFDVIFGFHNWPPLQAGTAACPAGPVMAANGEWSARIQGRGGHASMPHLCADPIYAGSQFVSAVQQVVARQVAPQEAAVVTVTCFHAGTADNIIPDAAELVGTCRAATTTRRDDLARRTEAVLHAACAPTGCTATFEFHPCYEATVNDPTAAGEAQAALAAEGISLIREQLPIMAAEDFGWFLARKPGAFLLLGSGRGPDTPGCHSARFDFDDTLIPLVVRLWARLAGL